MKKKTDDYEKTDELRPEDFTDSDKATESEQDEEENDLMDKNTDESEFEIEF